jgi:hypothetical protein
MKRSLALAGLLLGLASVAQAQTQAPATPGPAQTVTQNPNAAILFEQAVFITCREAHAFPVEIRQRLALFLADYAARARGVMIPDDERGGQLALLVRGGCTLSPDAHLFAVIDKAIVAEQAKLPKRQ